MCFLPMIMCPEPSGGRPGAQGCHEEEHTQDSALAQPAAEADWGQARAQDPRLGSQQPQKAGGMRVYVLCPKSSERSASGKMKGSVGVGWGGVCGV